MGIKRLYDRAPFSWDEKSAQTIQNDRNWLESITRNAAPLSDWWTKARIVQLAYPVPAEGGVAKTAGKRIYAGLNETEIVQLLREGVDPAQHPDFDKQVTEDFVINTLNAWKSQRFAQSISRNFDIYADRIHPNTFLVVSTAPVSLEVDRVLPPSDRFRPLFNVDELAKLVHAHDVNRLTLRTHGYSNHAESFYHIFQDEAKGFNTPDTETGTPPFTPDHFFIGYHWPSEQPVTSPGLWNDYRRAPGIVLKFLLVLSVLSAIFGTLLYLFLRLLGIPLLTLLERVPPLVPLLEWSRIRLVADYAVQLHWLIPTIFMLWLLLFLLLRIVVYQRDRYRAIHYGAPDLAEFFWRLDKALNKPENWAVRSSQNGKSDRNRRIKVNLLGHSMGALVVVNMLRTLSERFGKDDHGTLKPDSDLNFNEDETDDIGEHLELDKLILASPDIPLEFLREGRNNYVRSAMRRCRRIYLMSSDRDFVLRYLSTLANWFIEPSIQMAGLRLGNVYLREAPKAKSRKQFKSNAPTRQDIRVEKPTVPEYLPYIRIMLHSEKAVQPTSSYELFRKFNYLDCSEMGGSGKDGGVNSVPFKLNGINGLLIDALNIAWFALGSTTGINRLDIHGGYFQTQTRSFQILQFLLTASPFLSDEVIKAEIARLVEGSPIRFLPSQPWVMPKSENVAGE
ncbi:alpha/beta hydrolase [Oscillatoria sp. FACHB-1407]|uniref:alpha/beta hydrolase n=1 Tax=Oscillatoria sp. FACHB-1407 TaxID=2692847 RepID=UPI001683572B|nr:alpha/beta hydrolase [Oscillatoria sp. FACHB-1407]MBD2460205.1 alpha/beta hydrolase [Oscillatoria sp. FACHB-1407]